MDDVMAAEKLGTQELRDVLVFSVTAASVFAAAIQDGRFDYADAFLLMGLIAKAGPALAGIRSVRAEIEDLDTDEKAKLMKDLEAEMMAQGMNPLYVQAALGGVMAILTILQTTHWV